MNFQWAVKPLVPKTVGDFLINMNFVRIQGYKGSPTVFL